MIQKLILVLFSFCLLPLFALDGDQHGNGGGGVICRSEHGKILTVKTLDVYEAELRQIPLEFGPKSDKPLVVVDYLLKRMAKRDPIQAEVYRKKAKEFFNPKVTRFLKDVELPFTEDTGAITLLKGCKIEQIILQRQPQVPEDHLHTVNEDLWRRLDANNQAALILHEVIYREWLLENQHLEKAQQISFWARYYNELILSPLLSQKESLEYVKLLKTCGFHGNVKPEREVPYLSGVYFLNSLKIENDEVISGVLSRPSEIPVANYHIKFIGHIEFVKGVPSRANIYGVQPVQIGKRIYHIGPRPGAIDDIVFENGIISTVSMGKGSTIPVSPECSHNLEGGEAYFDSEGELLKIWQAQGICVRGKGGRWLHMNNTYNVEFYPSAFPERITHIYNPLPFEFDVFEKTFPFLRTEVLAFHPNGNIKTGSMKRAEGAAETIQLFGTDGKWHIYELSYYNSSQFQFDENGKVIVP